MASDVMYPMSASLEEIARDKLPRLTADRPIFECFPIENEDAFLIMWEQEDNLTGLQNVRGLNGDPPKVARIGSKRFMETPGAYGEFEMVDEIELTQRRQIGTFNAPIDISDIVMRIQDHLLQRELDRIELIIWTLLATGSFSIVGPNGAPLHTGTYLRQTFSSAVHWSVYATATPLYDMRQIQLLARGHSVSFGRNARAFMNRKTANNMLVNTNAADLYGRRTAGLGTFNTVADVNTFYAAEDLPQIVVYDEGYLTDGSVVQNATDFTQMGTFAVFIPDATVIIVGVRPGGAPLGKYKMIRNANNPGSAPGPYMVVVDSADGDDGPPRKISVHRGHNGGPTLQYPSAVAVMSV